MKAYVMLISLLLIATPFGASADRTWDLEGRGTVQIAGLGSARVNVTGALTLFGDMAEPVGTRSYSLTIQVEGEPAEVSTGLWLEERNRIQLLPESPTPREVIADLEALLSDLFSMPISLTSSEEKISININSRTQELRISSRGSLTARPGLRGNQPLRFRETLRLTGRLVSP